MIDPVMRMRADRPASGRRPNGPDPDRIESRPYTASRTRAGAQGRALVGGGLTRTTLLRGLAGVALLDALAARLFDVAARESWSVAAAWVVDRDMVTVVAVLAAWAVAGLSRRDMAIGVSHAAGSTASVTLSDVLAAVTTALVLLLPHASAGWMALGVLGVYGMLAWRDTPGPHAAASILAAVAVYEIGGRLTVGLTGPVLAEGDAAAAAWALAQMGAPAALTGALIETRAGHDLVIVNACLSLRAILQAWLVFFTATRIARPHAWHASELVLGLVLALLVFALNTGRIVIYAIDFAAYQALHDGALSPLFGLIVLALALATATWGVRHEFYPSRVRR
jgi:hypothetical protein